MEKLFKSVLVVILVYFSLVISDAGQFKVKGDYDGDTLKAENKGYGVKVRLVGIDSPETSKKKHQPGQPFSKQAKIYLQKLVLNKIVKIEGYALVRYSRVLGVVYIDGKNVTLEMVKEGLAEVYRGPPAKGLDLGVY